MKKMILLLMSLLIVVNCAVAKVQEFDPYKDRDPKASKILFDVILRDEEWTKEEAAKNFNVNLDKSSAFFVDLNDDGVNEIIGVNWSSFFFCKQGLQIFILHKEKGEYKNISDGMHFEPQRKIKVLDEKTFGFRDILTYCIDLRHIPWSDAPYNPSVFKYYKGKYVYEYVTKQEMDYQCPVPQK